MVLEFNRYRDKVLGEAVAHSSTSLGRVPNAPMGRCFSTGYHWNRDRRAIRQPGRRRRTNEYSPVYCAKVLSRIFRLKINNLLAEFLHKFNRYYK